MSHEFCHDFGVRVRLENMALAHEEHLDVLVVRDDAVVDEDERVVIVGTVGMSVDGAGNTVSGPTSVSNPHMARVNHVKFERISLCKQVIQNS